jgi:hypothetical protein
LRKAHKIDVSALSVDEEDDPLFDFGFDLLLKGLLRLPFNEVYMETSLFEQNSAVGILAVQTPGYYCCVIN